MMRMPQNEAIVVRMRDDGVCCCFCLGGRYTLSPTTSPPSLCVLEQGKLPSLGAVWAKEFDCILAFIELSTALYCDPIIRYL